MYSPNFARAFKRFYREIKIFKRFKEKLGFSREKKRFDREIFMKSNGLFQ